MSCITRAGKYLWESLVFEDLEDFLFARIAEEEKMADKSVQVGDGGMRLVIFDALKNSAPILIVHPDRVLDDCQARFYMIKRAMRLINQDKPDFGQYNVLIDLASPYRKHPDFKSDWIIKV